MRLKTVNADGGAIVKQKERTAMPKVSIVIPVYNTAPYLRRCMDSIINQTLKDIEIICVNDASSDDSLSILQGYAREDSRVAVIDLERNHGETRARNAALAKAAGEYIGFVDSDDYIDEHFFEALHTAATKEHADIAKCNRKTVEIDGSVTFMEHNTSVRNNKFFFIKGFTTAIYSKKMLQHNAIEFPGGITNHGDIVFLVKAVYAANKVATIDTAWYYCEKRPESSSHGIDFPKRLAAIASATEMIVDFLNSVEIAPEPYVHIFNTELMSIYRQGCEWKNEDAVTHCLDIFARCRYKEQLLSSLMPVLARLFRNGDRHGLIRFYQFFSTKQFFIHFMAEHLRESVRDRLRPLSGY